MYSDYTLGCTFFYNDFVFSINWDLELFFDKLSTRVLIKRTSFIFFEMFLSRPTILTLFTPALFKSYIAHPPQGAPNILLRQKLFLTLCEAFFLLKDFVPCFESLISTS